MPFNELIDNRCRNKDDDMTLIIMKMMDHQDSNNTNKIPGVIVVIINENGEATIMTTTLVDRIVSETPNPKVAAVIVLVAVKATATAIAIAI